MDQGLLRRVAALIIQKIFLNCPPERTNKSGEGGKNLQLWQI